MAVIEQETMPNIIDVTPILSVTPSAVEVIRNLLQQRNIPNHSLRVFVSGGGCSGMQYGLVFDEKRDDDFSAQFHGVSVLVDPFSANYLRGSVVDFSEELTGGGFKISNPNARQSCGCGKSFEA